MTTPEQKRERARQLREVARTISDKAELLDDDIDTLLERYPENPDGVWWGTSAAEFYDGVRDVRRDVRTLRTDVLDYAQDCRERAQDLEDQADTQEATEAGEG